MEKGVTPGHTVDPEAMNSLGNLTPFPSVFRKDRGRVGGFGGGNKVRLGQRASVGGAQGTGLDCAGG